MPLAQLVPPVLLALLAQLAPLDLLVLLAPLVPPVPPVLLAQLVPPVLPALLVQLVPPVLLAPLVPPVLPALLARQAPLVLPALLAQLVLPALLGPGVLREQLRPVLYSLHILHPVSQFPPIPPCCLTEMESPPEMRSPIQLEAGALPSISPACIRLIFTAYCLPMPILRSQSISSRPCSKTALLFRVHLFLTTSKTARRAYPSRFPFRSPSPMSPPPCKSFHRAQITSPVRLH